MEWRRWWIGFDFSESLFWIRTRRSHGVLVRVSLSRMFGWMTTWRGRDATMTLRLGVCLSCWMKDCGSVDLARVKR